MEIWCKNCIQQATWIYENIRFSCFFGPPCINMSDIQSLGSFFYYTRLPIWIMARSRVNFISNFRLFCLMGVESLSDRYQRTVGGRRRLPKRQPGRPAPLHSLQLQLSSRHSNQERKCRAGHIFRNICMTCSLRTSLLSKWHYLIWRPSITAFIIQKS